MLVDSGWASMVDTATASKTSNASIRELPHVRLYEANTFPCSKTHKSSCADDNLDEWTRVGITTSMKANLMIVL